MNSPEDFESHLRSFRPVAPPALPLGARRPTHRRWLALAAGLLAVVLLALEAAEGPAVDPPEPSAVLVREPVRPVEPAPSPEAAGPPNYLAYRTALAADPVALDRLLDRQARRPFPRPVRSFAESLH